MFGKYVSLYCMHLVVALDVSQECAGLPSVLEQAPEGTLGSYILGTAQSRPPLEGLLRISRAENTELLVSETAKTLLPDGLVGAQVRRY